MDKQEPIAWMVYTLDGTSVCVTDNPADFTENHRVFPLYTAPAAREWVGLTDDEVYQAESGCWFLDEFDKTLFARAIEAKLKEKNK